MKERIEIQIGEVTTIGSQVVMCLLDYNDSDERCNYCCLNGSGECWNVECLNCFRRDGQNVFFAEVKSINSDVLSNKKIIK